MKIEAFLSALVPLTESELTVLTSLLKTESLEKGTYYLENGQTCHKVSFINEGLFKMSMVDSSGSEKIIEFLGTCEFVTDYISFLNQKPTDCDIVALKASVLQSINFSDLQNLYEHSPNFQKLGRLLAEQNFIRFAERIKSQALPPQERYRLLCNNTNLMLEVPQYMIASYLGLSAEWLSKLRAKR